MKDNKEGERDKGKEMKEDESVNEGGKRRRERMKDTKSMREEVGRGKREDAR